MSTTAVHIGLTSDLSTSTFIESLDRFLSCRRRCSYLYTDRGTNFVGTDWYLREVYNIINEDAYTRHVKNKQIKWHFNPPATPHMGGLWEAAIKSAKSLLQMVIQDQILTYEELNKVLYRVEASINSQALVLHHPTPVILVH